MNIETVQYFKMIGWILISQNNLVFQPKMIQKFSPQEKVKGKHIIRTYLWKLWRIGLDDGKIKQ